MKINKLLFVLIILISIFFFTCNKSGWEVVIEVSPSHSSNNAGFINETNGITVGFGGNCFFTEDGGKSWTKAENRSLCRFGLEIVDGNIAYNSGNGAQNRITNDGGKTWSEIADFGLSEPNHCRFISFINKDIGWIASADRLGKTINSGKEWQKIVLPANIGKILGIDLIDENSGIIFDDNKKIFFTENNGNSWNEKKIDIKSIDFLSTLSSAPSNAVRFKDNDNGILIVRQIKPKKQWIALTTMDSGENWKSEKLPGDYSTYSSVFLSKDQKYLTIISTGQIYVLRRK